MRIGALILGVAALGLASIEPASARINCGPGMNSDGYGCVPIAPQRRLDCGPGMNSDGYGCVPIGVRRNFRHSNSYDGGPDYYYRGRPRGPRDCGPGMNSDGYRCVPIRGRYYR